jgi:hypothetical protein
MAQRLIKTIKHGIIVLFAMLENADYWDEQLANVMFGYRCEIQANIKFSPFMILIGCTPGLRANNYLHSMTIVVDDTIDAGTIEEQFLQKNEADSKHP